MAGFRQGDYVKAAFPGESTGESKRMRVEAESRDNEAGILFGKLDSVPLAGIDLRLGDEIAASYDKAIEHRKASEFEKQ